MKNIAWKERKVRLTNILIINDFKDLQNWGAKATSYALDCMLKKYNRNMEVYSLPNNYFGVSKHERFGSAKRILNIPNKLIRKTKSDMDIYPSVADDFDYYKQKWISYKAGDPGEQFIALTNKADIVIFNGENTIYPYSKDGLKGLFLLYVAKYGLKKHACVINQTSVVSPPIRPDLRGVVQMMYPELDLVTTREPFSQLDLEKIGITNSIMIPDPVFTINSNFEAEDIFEDWSVNNGLLGEKYFCISFGSMPNRILESVLMRNSPLVDLIEKLKRYVPIPVIVESKPSNMKYIKVLARATGAKIFSPNHSFFELWPLFRNAQYLISGRYHHVIISAKVGCPVIPLATTTHKMEGLLSLLEWNFTKPYNPGYLKPFIHEINRKSEQIINNREYYSLAIKQLTPKLSNWAEKLPFSIFNGVTLNNRKYENNS